MRLNRVILEGLSITSQRETSSISERTKIDFRTRGQEEGSNQRCFWWHIKGLSNSLSAKWASDESMWASGRCCLCQSPAVQSPRCQTALINTPQYKWKGLNWQGQAAVQWFNIRLLFRLSLGRSFFSGAFHVSHSVLFSRAYFNLTPRFNSCG